MTKTPGISLDELRARLNATGFNPNESSLREIHAAWPYFDAMRARVRRSYTHGDEPAHLFMLERK